MKIIIILPLLKKKKLTIWCIL